MSKNEDSNSPISPSTRRASYAGQRLSELFGRPPPIITGTPAFPGPITAAAHQANQKRRMSIASVGLGASPTQGSPSSTPHTRQDSFSSSGSAPGDSAIDDSGDQAAPLGSSPTFRRLSFGSRAMGQMSGGITNGRLQSVSDTSPSSTSPSRSRVLPPKLVESTEEDQQAPPSSSTLQTPSKLSNVFNRPAGESGGFNWSTEMRNRAQRSSSIASPTGNLSVSLFPQKSASIAPAPVPPPPPAAIKQQTPPDHFQERILKGDFYMD